MAMGGGERDPSGKTRRVAGIAIDISDRKAREDEMALLTRELSHRIKNIFTIMTSLTSMAANEDEHAGPALRKLASRMGAMSAAYSQVVPPLEGGVAPATQLKALLDCLMSPYDGADTERVTVDGPDIDLDQKAASSFALIIHELATNSVKYGALSQDGHVRISITAAKDGRFSLCWTETGGPRASGAPSTTGFGSRLIEVSAASLNADISADWQATGLVWQMSGLLADLQDQ